MTIHKEIINGLEVKTGDLICTTDGGETFMAGQIWRLIGKLIPGDVDHIAIYVGPNGRCVEAGAKLKVVAFDVPNGNWNADIMAEQRGHLMDTIYGVAYPLAGRNFTPEKEAQVREKVAAYCLAQIGKPYNINFLDSATEKAFYCSHLAYKAYLQHDIDLNSGREIPDIPGTASIIFPQEVWAGCQNQSV